LHAPIKSFTHAGLSKSAYKDLLLEILIFSSYLNISTFTYGLIANDELPQRRIVAPRMIRFLLVPLLSWFKLKTLSDHSLAAPLLTKPLSLSEDGRLATSCEVKDWLCQLLCTLSSSMLIQNPEGALKQVLF
jgi:hypothetical protein